MKTFLKLIKRDNAHDNGSNVLSAFDPIGKVPNWGLEKGNKVKKLNRYLRVQNERVIKSVNNGEYDKAVIIMCLLLKNSLSFQFYLFHSTKPYGYGKKDTQEVTKIFIESVNKLRQFNLRLYISRFYIIKNKKEKERNGVRGDGGDLKPGEKLRPIGSPDWTSSMISKAFTDLITCMFDSNRGLTQHGYRPRLGVHTCIMRVIKIFDRYEKPHIMEYDYRSFFNKVSLNGVCYKLESKSKLLSILIRNLIYEIRYKMGYLVPESELTMYGMKAYRNDHSPLILRGGLPQGLSLSPLLSTLAQEFIHMPDNNISYADDGLGIDDDRESFYFYLDSLGGFGVSIADEKTREVDQNKWTLFCGYEIKFSERLIRIDGRTYSFDDKSLEESLKVHSGHYAKRAYAGMWDIHDNAEILQHKIPGKEIPILKLIMVYLKAIGCYGEHKGLKYISQKGIFDVSRSSSICAEALGNRVRGLRYLKKKDLKISAVPSPVEVYKHGYYETFYEVEMFEGTNNFSENIEIGNMLRSE